MLENLVEFDQNFRFLIDDKNLTNSKIDIIFYLINLKNGIESAYLQTSLNIGDVYLSNLNTKWLTLNDLDKVILKSSHNSKNNLLLKATFYCGELLISLCYLPTAERLRVIVVEGKNLQFENNSFFGGNI